LTILAFFGAEAAPYGVTGTPDDTGPEPAASVADTVTTYVRPTVSPDSEEVVPVDWVVGTPSTCTE
jgi:hypothetical protein